MVVWNEEAGKVKGGETDGYVPVTIGLGWMASERFGGYNASVPVDTGKSVEIAVNASRVRS